MPTYCTLRKGCSFWRFFRSRWNFLVLGIVLGVTGAACTHAVDDATTPIRSSQRLPFSDVMPEDVYALVADTQGRIYAAGHSTGVSRKKDARVAVWDGIQWMPLKGPMPYKGSIYCMAVDQSGVIYIGGDRSEDVKNSGFTFRWNGERWEKMPSLPITVAHLLVDDKGTLYAGGYEIWTMCGDTYNGAVYQWDGILWQRIGPSLSGAVTGLQATSGDIYMAVGMKRGTTTSGGIYILQGKTYIPISGMDSYVSAFFREPSGAFHMQVECSDECGRRYSSMCVLNDGFQRTVLRPPGKRFIQFGIDRPGCIFAVTWAYAENSDITSCVFKWSGKEWVPWGPEVTGKASAILTGADGKIYLGGAFRDNQLASPNASSMQSVIVGDGSSWSHLKPTNSAGVQRNQ